LTSRADNGTPVSDLSLELARAGITVSDSGLRRLIRATRQAEYEQTHAPRRRALPDDTRAVLDILEREPWTPLTEIGDRLNLHPHDLPRLKRGAMAAGTGYTLSLRSPATEWFTSAQYTASVKACAKALGLKRGEPVSKGAYKKWRNALPEAQKAQHPSDVSILRRGGGSWNTALAELGFNTNAPVRDYVGLSDDDITLHIAHFLRSLNKTQPMVEATATRYRLWLAGNPSTGAAACPEAPSLETIRQRGRFSGYLDAAARIERTTSRLPKPQPVTASKRRRT
jgi:hypothetical protein